MAALANGGVVFLVPKELKELFKMFDLPLINASQLAPHPAFKAAANDKAGPRLAAESRLAFRGVIEESERVQTLLGIQHYPSGKTEKDRVTRLYIRGLAMLKLFAPHLADLFLKLHESELLVQHPDLSSLPLDAIHKGHNDPRSLRGSSKRGALAARQFSEFAVGLLQLSSATAFVCDVDCGRL